MTVYNRSPSGEMFSEERLRTAIHCGTLCNTSKIINRLIGPYPPADNPYVAIDLGLIDYLWVPDIYIYHLKTIKVLNIFTQFAGKLVTQPLIFHSHDLAIL